MTEQLPEPLTPAECDLQDFAFMPLDVARLRDSDLASDETPEACWAAVLLWSASWHQIPAASIPDNDQWIAKQAGYALRGKVDKAWKNVRAGALRGWVKCSDGRLYHPVVAEKARDAWSAKHEQRYRTECARIKKHNQRHGTSIPYPTLDQFLMPSYKDPVPKDIANVSPGTRVNGPENVPGETPSKGQGEGQGQGQGYIKNTPPEPDPVVNPAPPAADEPPCVEPPPALESPKPLPDPTKTGAMAGALRRLNVGLHSQSPYVVAWVEDGFSVDDLIEAVGIARLQKPAPQTIPAGYLDSIMRRQVSATPKTRGKKVEAELDAWGIAL